MVTTAEINNALPLVVQLLLDKGILDSAQSEGVRNIQLGNNSSLEGALVEQGLVSEQDITQVYSEYLVAPIFEPLEDAVPVDRTLARFLPEKLCRDQLIAPISVNGGTIEVAFVSPDGLSIVDEIEFLTELTVRPFVTSRSVVEELIEALYCANSSYSAKKKSSKKLIAKAKVAKRHQVEEDGSDDEDRGLTNEEILNLDQPLPSGPDGRVFLLVNQIVEQALRRGASDIHIEPFEETCKVRVRVDGILQELTPPPQALYLAVVSRFKILAKMDIAEKRVPQDGAIALRTQEKRIDMRVNTIPTVWGEKVVMRILDKGAIPVQLTGLGFDERQSTDLVESIEMPHGLMLVTGPTGSGKSTTLYACLNFRNHPDTNICTVEDPVEYKFDGMNQVQVKSQVGLTFSSVLRAFLRQDPDVIMVGEVRDQETAQICLRAALTGHFVLSTIHTNDSLSAVSRLQDMGVEPFLLAATLRVLEAQRLIRRLCKECKQPYECDPETSRLHGFEVGQELFRAKGCDACRGTGYRGRVGVFEVVRITSGIADLIQRRTPLPELRQAAQDEGMRTLAESAVDKVREGTTSLEEALAITMAGKE